MAVSLFQFIFALTLVYYIYTWILSYVTERKFRKFAEANGCGEPYKIKNLLPGGVERIFKIITAPLRGQDILDDLVMPGQRLAGWTSEWKGVGGRYAVTTSEPKNIQALLATNFKDFEQGALRHAQFGVLLGKSILNSDGAFWEHSRAVLRPQFSRDQINDLEETERSTQIMLQAMPTGSDNWASVDISDLFFRFTLDNATSFLFGTSIDSLKGAIPGGADEARTEAERMAQGQGKQDFTFAQAIAIVQEGLARRIQLQGLYRLRDGPKFRRAIAFVRRFVGFYVEAALAGESKNTNKKYDLSTALTENIPNKDPIEIRDQLLSGR